MRVGVLCLLGALGTGIVFAHPAEDRQTEAEVAAIAKIVAGAEAGVRKQFAVTGKALRDAHGKHHGCVRARFLVENQLPETVRSAIFKEGASYPSWIRLSNGEGGKNDGDDRIGDGRGMAIKLMDVPGEKILANERDEKTQDFILINHPAFFVRNAVDYVEFGAAAKAGKPMDFFFPGKNPLHWRLHEFNVVRKIRARKVLNPLETRYFSMVPVALGERAIKYSVWPCPGSKFEHVASSKNQLAEALAEQLKKGDACLVFGVQLQSDKKRMPVEDPTIEWSERRSHFVKVATIRIGKQDFAGNNDFCENLSFTPWHAVADHQPLGGIQRIRKVVYERISQVRHELNKEARREPKPEGVF